MRSRPGSPWTRSFPAPATPNSTPTPATAPDRVRPAGEPTRAASRDRGMSRWSSGHTTISMIIAGLPVTAAPERDGDGDGDDSGIPADGAGSSVPTVRLVVAGLPRDPQSGLADGDPLELHHRVADRRRPAVARRPHVSARGRPRSPGWHPRPPGQD